MDYLILVINPGSTSTKIAIFNNDKLIQEQTLKHDVDIIQSFPTIISQKDFRKQIIIDFLTDHHYSLTDIDVFVGRGGMLKPIKTGGTFLVTPAMVDELKAAKYGQHASNLGAVLAFEMAKPLNRPAYIVNPVCVDEMEDIARVSGLKGMERTSIFHALNHKAIGKRYAKSVDRDYDDLNLIIAHLGGGFSVALHRKGRVVDVNNALGGTGPFSPERTGTLPTFPLVEMCFSGQYSLDEIKRLLAGKGGLVSYLGTSNGLEIKKRIEAGDQEARFYFQAMAYNVAKEIGSLYFVNKGQIDAIILTGGLAYSSIFVDMIKEYVQPIQSVSVFPGEDEMRALAEGTLRVLNKQEKLQVY
ncbi:MAG TPA: butyrate kinase [Candidatus Izemoplasmatales bacterium]|nr:butyrate kinase [Bacillota bacterium]HRY77796.1 butyrate kinase [Candidatus Izemoplasmatales bacterium]